MGVVFCSCHRKQDIPSDKSLFTYDPPEFQTQTRRLQISTPKPRNIAPEMYHKTHVGGKRIKQKTSRRKNRTHRNSSHKNSKWGSKSNLREENKKGAVTSVNVLIKNDVGIPSVGGENELSSNVPSEDLQENVEHQSSVEIIFRESSSSLEGDWWNGEGHTTPDISKDIITDLTRLMSSGDAELKAVAKKIITQVVIPSANLNVTAAPKSRRTRSMIGVKELMKAQTELNNREISLHRTKSSMSDVISPVSYPSYSFSDEKQSLDSKLKKFQSNRSDIGEITPNGQHQEMLAFSEQQVEINQSKSNQVNDILASLPTLSQALRKVSVKSNWGREPHSQPGIQSDGEKLPDMHESRGLGNLTIDIDMLDKRIHERSSKIKHLRRQSIGVLTELPVMEFNYEPDSDMNTSTFMKLEKEISRLENEKTDLENRRNNVISQLQSKMLGGMMRSGRESLISVVPSSDNTAWSSNVIVPLTAIGEPGESNLPSREPSFSVDTTTGTINVDQVTKEIFEIDNLYREEGVFHIGLKEDKHISKSYLQQ